MKYKIGDRVVWTNANRNLGVMCIVHILKHSEHDKVYFDCYRYRYECDEDDLFDNSCVNFEKVTEKVVSPSEIWKELNE